MANLARRLYRYSNRVYCVGQALKQVKDGRRLPIHSLEGLLWKVIVGIMVGIPSFNQLEEAIRDGDFDHLGGRTRPSADTFRRAFKKLDLESLKGVKDGIVEHARRNKALEDARVEGYRVVAIDGTGAFSTTSSRLGRFGHRHRKQDDKHEPGDTDPPNESDETDDAIYLEKALGISYVGGEGATVLLELARIPKGKGETTVAVDVLRELFSRHYRYCDFITVDAGFAGAPFLNEVLQENKDFVVRVKQENYDIIKDADALFDTRPASEYHADVKLRQERIRYDVEIWDDEEFTSWEQVDRPLRCLRVRETRKKINAAGEVVDSTTVTTHFVTSAAQAVVPALTIWKIAHARWDVENTGFHFLKHHFELEHAYSYDPEVIEVILTLFAIAFNLFMLFVHRNLRTFHPKRHTLLGVMRSIYRGLVRLHQPLQWPHIGVSTLT